MPYRDRRYVYDLQGRRIPSGSDLPAGSYMVWIGGEWRVVVLSGGGTSYTDEHGVGQVTSVREGQNTRGFVQGVNLDVKGLRRGFYVFRYFNPFMVVLDKDNPEMSWWTSPFALAWGKALNVIFPWFKMAFSLFKGIKSRR